MAVVKLTTPEKIEKLKFHIVQVQSEAFRMADRLIEDGKEDLARRLIANVLRHDNSKFYGIQWKCLWPGDPLLAEAYADHVCKELHHPDAWDSIHDMTDEYLCEFVCDCKARANQFGTSLIDWMDEEATTRYKFTKRDEVYKKIKYFVELLCERPFKAVPQRKSKDSE